MGSIAIAIDAPPDQASLRARRPGATPVVIATPEVRLSYAILNRHLFMNRQALRLPTGLLLDGSGNVVKVYRDRVDVDQIVTDAGAIDVSRDRAPRSSPALSGHVPFRIAAPQLPAVPAGTCSITDSSGRQ